MGLFNLKLTLDLAPQVYCKCPCFLCAVHIDKLGEKACNFCGIMTLRLPKHTVKSVRHASSQHSGALMCCALLFPKA